MYLEHDVHCASLDLGVTPSGARWVFDNPLIARPLAGSFNCAG